MVMSSCSFFLKCPSPQLPAWVPPPPSSPSLVSLYSYATCSERPFSSNTHSYHYISPYLALFFFIASNYLTIYTYKYIFLFIYESRSLFCSLYLAQSRDSVNICWMKERRKDLACDMNPLTQGLPKWHSPLTCILSVVCGFLPWIFH